MIEDRERCARIVASRDARFDGWLFVGVTSTGIYCRPSCPARSPRREHMRFFTTAAGAVGAGFRACLRCRPDATPGSPEWRRRDLAARAMRLIADGVVERDGVAGLAARLHVSPRHLQRTLVDEVGCGALALARAERSRTARLLLETTDLPVARIAFAAGFGSVRQFNDTIGRVFARTPSELRRRRTDRGVAPVSGRISVRLPARAPFDLAPLMRHLAARAIPGVERIEGARYRRTLDLAHGVGVASVHDADPGVRLDLRLDDLRDLPAAVRRTRLMLDLDADPEAVDEALGHDPVLAPLVAAAPGTRVPAAVDAMEAAARVVVGQQVSVAGARAVLARIAAAHGAPLEAVDGGLVRRFPSHDALAACDPDLLPLPRVRARALVALAGAIARGDLHLDPGAAPDDARAMLRAIPGIGPWSAEMIAMRALGDPDAFPASDLGLRRATAVRGVRAVGPHGRACRPWRAYAAQLLWNADSTSETRRSMGAAAWRMTA